MGGSFDTEIAGSTTPGDGRAVGDGGGPTRGLDRVCQLLGHRWCRFVLYHRHETDDPTSLDALIEAIRRWESRDPSTPLPRGSIEVDLGHNHPPRLADYDALAFEPRTETVRVRSDCFERDWFESLKESELEVCR